MELIPIIKASLGIFTIITAITVMISYSVYKWKSRNRAKPYEIEHKATPAPVVIELESDAQKNHRFEILNENDQVLEKLLSVNESGMKNIKGKSNSDNNKALNTKKKNENEVFNIYNFYSSNELRPMHKLKPKHAE